MEQTTVYYILLAAAALILILLVWLLVVTLSRQKGDETARLLQQMQGELERSLQEDVLALGKYQMENQRRQAESDSKNLQDKLLLFENRLSTYSQQTARRWNGSCIPSVRITTKNWMICAPWWMKSCKKPSTTG